ncbi:octopamine receptor 1-like [Dendronephthya gigantea]|uniref:octopamine receptor 1-like n=1 Tax=Dendronephthya gigantea TaxID=151771 RepID=UPI00106C15CC|nr:octopamine receptor 1-like [Dendronephthya gigantea]
MLANYSSNQTYFNTTSSTTSNTTSLIVTIIQLLAFTTVILTAFVGNILVCIAVYKFRQLQTTTNIALVSLAVTDILMVYVITLHAIMVIQGRWTFGNALCKVTGSVGLTLNLMSLLHLAYISLDRFIAIIKPFRYQVWITKQRVIKAMFLMWFIAILLLNGPWGDFEYRANVFGCLNGVKRGEFKLSTFIMLIVFVSLPSAFILFTQIWVCNVARDHARKMNKQQTNLRISYSEPSPPVMSREKETRYSRKTTAETKYKREMKSVKTFGILVGCFLVCYIPFYTVATLRSFNGLNSVQSSILTTVTWIAFVNSAMNPILYSLRHRQFKTAFEKIFRKGLARIAPMQLPETSRRNSVLGNSSSFQEGTLRNDNSLVTIN